MPQAENETREDYLHRLLAEVVDAVVGSSYHDLYGHGYTDEEITEVETVCRAYWDEKWLKDGAMHVGPR